MLELLRNACYDGGNLRRVREIPLDPNHLPIMAVELQFDTLTIAFSAIADDDTIAVTSGSYSGPSRQTISSLWASCIGKSLQWTWLMTNQQGYTDGARLEFTDPDNQQSVIIELVAGASSLCIYLARPTEA
ncbi:hypothetical protein ABB26_11515 [Stenotrophomonas humi]|uniref:Uncharacterized protein n=1 Tax=Stenotrophomonas humi TaxID=405444 RepID=A0A0R0CBH1_9GAMM|nr:DUF6334 family protein [Stenotrophomonas humi]KRG63543.1 hypothetical protein ABB26_11515 [Stenotrophomonas humi]